jgi:hypothetical protein
LKEAAMSKVFDPKELREIAKKGIGLPHDQMFHAVHEELLRKYPGHIRKNPRWILNIAGGAMGQVQILHGSLSEYLIFFGTPIGTEGHSGRYFADVWDWTIDGEAWCYLEGETERRVYKPGDEMHLLKGKAKGYCIKDHSWMLEYGRGCIPTMLPFGLLASNMCNTLDCVTVWRTLCDYAPVVTKELLKGKI